MIERDYLLSEADGFTVAEYLGMEILKRGSRHYILCPGHEKRLGKQDMRMGNAVLTNKGYHCYACNKSVNVIDMTMEYTGCSYPEALNMIADACGGRSIFEIDGNNQPKAKRLPLSPIDLELIGLSSSGKSTPIINVSTTMVENDEDTFVRQSDDKYFVYQRNNVSLTTLYQTDLAAYNHLIAEKAKIAMETYKTAIEKYCSRDAEKAEFIYNLFNENGYLAGDVFYKLKNSFQKKYWRAKEIYDTYKE